MKALSSFEPAEQRKELQPLGRALGRRGDAPVAVKDDEIRSVAGQRPDGFRLELTADVTGIGARLRGSSDIRSGPPHRGRIYAVAKVSVGAVARAGLHLASGPQPDAPRSDSGFGSQSVGNEVAG